jgi:formylglycine-generating enzyme required for sulfatase activity
MRSSRRRRGRLELSLRLLAALAAVLALTWGKISEWTCDFGTDPNGDAVYRRAAGWSRIDPSDGSPPRLRNSLDMELAFIPSGRYIMGSPSSQEFRQPDEWPHRVEIVRPFYLGVCEVTVEQFGRFAEAAGYRTELERADRPAHRATAILDGLICEPEYSWRTPGFTQQGDHPVVAVTWGDATAFCQWLSRCEGCRYRLPTEAEWEWACRAGQNTLAAAAGLLEPDTANLRQTQAAAHRGADPSWFDGYRFTAPVGVFRPDALGLHDMLGNVKEWCGDRYEVDYYRQADTRDPQGPSTGSARAIRGASFVSLPNDARPANRGYMQADLAYYDLGFRVVLECDAR